MAKIIKNFNIDLSSIRAEGDIRQFSVIGDDNSIFSLEVTNEDGYYYNFNTNTFAAAYKRLKNQKLVGGVYKGSITFPSVGDPDQYNISLYAESQHDTMHADYNEVRFGDGSMDINSSTGSSSNLLKKVIYQYDDVVVTLSAISPNSTYRSTGNFHGMSVTADTITLGRGDSSGKTPFSIGVTVATTKAIQITRQPTSSDLSAVTSVTMDSGVLIPNEDIWAGAARSTDTVNGASEASTTVTMDTAVATKMVVGDRVTGTGIASTSVVTVASLDGTYRFVASEAVTISDGVTLTFTPPRYYRWSINSGSTHSIHKLLPGMRMFTADSDIDNSNDNVISSYIDNTLITTEINNEGEIVEVVNTVVNASSPALDPLVYKPTITNGVVSKQLGYITFNNQIHNDLNSISANYIAYGPDIIKAIHNAEIRLTDLKVELTAPTTTTTAAVHASTTIPVADREGTIVNVSTISGIGIDPSVANPTIASATADGAGSWTASVAQTLESGITLTVGGTSRTATITGNIELENVDDTSFTVYFDLEKFLSAS